MGIVLRYFCGCFIYAQPTAVIVALVRSWSKRTSASRFNGGNFNQPALNGVLLEWQGPIDFAELPAAQFPPGCKMGDSPNASVIHVNWVSGLPSKVDRLKERGLWA